MANPIQSVHAWITARRVAGANDVGASLVEYALLVALIALVCFVAVGYLGETASSSYDDVGNSLVNTN